MTRPKGDKPKKPRKDFPLFAHANGTWAKTIDGKHVHFGAWHSPAKAEAKYKAFIEARRMGQTPPNDGSIRLFELANRFLSDLHARLGNKEITVSYYADAKRTIDGFLKAIGSRVTINHIRPEHFAAYRSELGKYAASTANLRMAHVRIMFKWAYDNDLISRPVKMGTSFKRFDQRRAKKVRLFTVEEVRQMIEGASGQLKAMILLAINCGMGNTDIATLRWSDVDLVKGMYDGTRQKTGTARRCPLWPETVEALKVVQATDRPRAADPDNADVVFLTRFGHPVRRPVPIIKDDVVVGAQTMDALAPMFQGLMVRIGLWKVSAKGNAISDGRNFYTLRRTHRTWSDECRDHHAAALIMGHETGNEIASMYVQHIDDSRLRTITDHIRSKLFTDKTESPSRRARPSRGGASR